jgi:hypothetical protein
MMPPAFKEIEFVKSSTCLASCPKSKLPEYAFVAGRTWEIFVDKPAYRQEKSRQNIFFARKDKTD